MKIVVFLGIFSVFCLISGIFGLYLSLQRALVLKRVTDSLARDRAQLKRMATNLALLQANNAYENDRLEVYKASKPPSQHRSTSNEERPQKRKHETQTA